MADGRQNFPGSWHGSWPMGVPGLSSREDFNALVSKASIPINASVQPGSISQQNTSMALGSGKVVSQQLTQKAPGSLSRSAWDNEYIKAVQKSAQVLESQWQADSRDTPAAVSGFNGGSVQQQLQPQNNNINGTVNDVSPLNDLCLLQQLKLFRPDIANVLNNAKSIANEGAQRGESANGSTTSSLPHSVLQFTSSSMNNSDASRNTEALLRMQLLQQISAEQQQLQQQQLQQQQQHLLQQPLMKQLYSALGGSVVNQTNPPINRMFGGGERQQSNAADTLEAAVLHELLGRAMQNPSTGLGNINNTVMPSIDPAFSSLASRASQPLSSASSVTSIEIKQLQLLQLIKELQQIEQEHRLSVLPDNDVTSRFIEQLLIRLRLPLTNTQTIREQDNLQCGSVEGHSSVSSRDDSGIERERPSSRRSKSSTGSQESSRRAQSTRRSARSRDDSVASRDGSTNSGGGRGHRTEIGSGSIEIKSEPVDLDLSMPHLEAMQDSVSSKARVSPRTSGRGRCGAPMARRGGGSARYRKDKGTNESAETGNKDITEAGAVDKSSKGSASLPADATVLWRKVDTTKSAPAEKSVKENQKAGSHSLASRECFVVLDSSAVTKNNAEKSKLSKDGAGQQKGKSEKSDLNNDANQQGASDTAGRPDTKKRIKNFLKRKQNEKDIQLEGSKESEERAAVASNSAKGLPDTQVKSKKRIAANKRNDESDQTGEHEDNEGDADSEGEQEKRPVKRRKASPRRTKGKGLKFKTFGGRLSKSNMLARDQLAKEAEKEGATVTPEKQKRTENGAMNGLPASDIEVKLDIDALQADSTNPGDNALMLASSEGLDLPVHDGDIKQEIVIENEDGIPYGHLIRGGWNVKDNANENIDEKPKAPVELAYEKNQSFGVIDAQIEMSVGDEDQSFGLMDDEGGEILLISNVYSEAQISNVQSSEKMNEEVEASEENEEMEETSENSSPVVNSTPDNNSEEIDIASQGLNKAYLVDLLLQINKVRGSSAERALSTDSTLNKTRGSETESACEESQDGASDEKGNFIDRVGVSENNEVNQSTAKSNDIENEKVNDDSNKQTGLDETDNLIDKASTDNCSSILRGVLLSNQNQNANATTLKDLDLSGEEQEIILVAKDSTSADIDRELSKGNESCADATVVIREDVREEVENDLGDKSVNESGDDEIVFSGRSTGSSMSSFRLTLESSRDGSVSTVCAEDIDTVFESKETDDENDTQNTSGSVNETRDMKQHENIISQDMSIENSQDKHSSQDMGTSSTDSASEKVSDLIQEFDFLNRSLDEADSADLSGESSKSNESLENEKPDKSDNTADKKGTEEPVNEENPAEASSANVEDDDAVVVLKCVLPKAKKQKVGGETDPAFDPLLKIKEEVDEEAVKKKHWKKNWRQEILKESAHYLVGNYNEGEEENVVSQYGRSLRKRQCRIVYTECDGDDSDDDRHGRSGLTRNAQHSHDNDENYDVSRDLRDHQMCSDDEGLGLLGETETIEINDDNENETEQVNAQGSDLSVVTGSGSTEASTVISVGGASASQAHPTGNVFIGNLSNVITINTAVNSAGTVVPVLVMLNTPAASINQSGVIQVLSQQNNTVPISTPNSNANSATNATASTPNSNPTKVTNSNETATISSSVATMQSEKNLPSSSSTVTSSIKTTSTVTSSNSNKTTTVTSGQAGGQYFGCRGISTVRTNRGKRRNYNYDPDPSETDKTVERPVKKLVTISADKLPPPSVPQISLLPSQNTFNDPSNRYMYVSRAMLNGEIEWMTLVTFTSVKLECQCVYCPAKRNSTPDVVNHISADHPKYVFALHAIKHAPNEPMYYRCRFCNYVAVNHHIMLIHFVEYHSVPGILSTDQRPKPIHFPPGRSLDAEFTWPTAFVCYDCNYLSDDQNHVLHHIISDHPNNSAIYNGYTVRYKQLTKPDKKSDQKTTFRMLVDSNERSHVKEVFRCCFCTNTAYAAYQSMAHALLKHLSLQMLMVCTQCDYNSVVTSDIDSHLRLIHNASESEKQCTVTLIEKSGKSYKEIPVTVNCVQAENDSSEKSSESEKVTESKKSPSKSKPAAKGKGKTSKIAVKSRIQYEDVEGDESNSGTSESEAGE